MRGRIVSFSGMDSLGDVELEDGRIVRFGARECGNILPVPGLEVEVPDVVPGRMKGQLRASQLILAGDVANLPWTRARVVEYEPVLHDGRVALADGRTAQFSAATRSLLAREPQIGLDVRVRVAAAAVLAIDEAMEKPSLAAQLARVQAAGFAREMTLPDLAALVSDCYGDATEDAQLWVLLHSWYEQHHDRAERDGYVTHDWRFLTEVDDPFAELATFSHLPAAIVVERMEEVETTEHGHAEAVLRFHLREAGTPRTLDVGSYADVVDMYDAALERAGATKSFVAVETGGDYFAYMFVADETARELAADRVIPFII